MNNLKLIFYILDIKEACYILSAFFIITLFATIVFYFADISDGKRDSINSKGYWIMGICFFLFIACQSFAAAIPDKKDLEQRIKQINN